MRNVPVGWPLSDHFLHNDVVSSVDDLRFRGYLAVRWHLEVVSVFNCDVSGFSVTYQLDSLWFTCVENELIWGQSSETFTCLQKL